MHWWMCDIRTLVFLLFIRGHQISFDARYLSMMRAKLKCLRLISVGDRLRWPLYCMGQQKLHAVEGCDSESYESVGFLEGN